MDVGVEGGSDWDGEVAFSLGAGAPSWATIDGGSGRLTLSPPADEAGGQQEVAVTAAAAGQTASTVVSVTVTRPVAVAPAELPEMVLIPAGEFLMGSDAGDSDEKPEHRVRITKPFYLGKYEVTQEQWAAVMGNNPSRFQGPKNPVEQVSWDDCQEFCRRLSAKEGKEYRLPTEAEWEYACRAGSTGEYCFGDEGSRLGEYAWYLSNSQRETHAVGQKRPNAWGLYDMHGNVWEWCADHYDQDYYRNSPVDDPQGPSGGAYRVNRGGSWVSTAGFCRSANRGRNSPGIRGNSLGFRLARVAAE